MGRGAQSFIWHRFTGTNPPSLQVSIEQLVGLRDPKADKKAAGSSGEGAGNSSCKLTQRASETVRDAHTFMHGRLKKRLRQLKGLVAGHAFKKGLPPAIKEGAEYHDSEAGMQVRKGFGHPRA